MEVSTSVLSVKEEDSISTFYKLETVHTDYFHIDVMDGKFVEKDTTDLMRAYADNLKNITNIPLDVHLMVSNVKEYVDMFAPCNPRIISFHMESLKNKEEILEMINYIKKDSMVGIAISPNTNIERVYEFLPYIHNVLVMTVIPGKGGQELIKETISKIKVLKEYIEKNKLNVEIEADGGINVDNIVELSDAGVDIAVVGTYMINAKDYQYTMKQLKMK